MTIRYHERGGYRNMPVVRALLATNMLFAVAILLAWQLAFMVVLGPLGWAVDQPMPSATTLETLFRYPLVLFWAGPALAMAIGWMLLQGRHTRLALGVLIIPVLMSVLMIGVFLFMPSAVI